jgi:hypothetical protein
VDLGTWTISLTHNVSHTGLVAHEASQVASLGSIILGEALDLSVGPLRALAGQEAQVTVTGMFKLTMRHF